MAEITDRPTRFPSAGYEADVWVATGRKVDGHSTEGRQAIEAAALVVFGRTVDQVGSGRSSRRTQSAASPTDMLPCDDGGVS